MKINGGGKVGGPDRSKGAARSAKGGSTSKAVTTPTTGAQDRIEVSDHVETLDVIRQMVSDTPDIRLEEVDRIVQQLKRGKYKVDFEKVAEGFIKEAILSEMTKKMVKREA